MHFSHFLDVAVAFSALDPFGDVRRVVKVDEVRNVVYSEPCDRFFLLELSAETNDLRLVGGNQLVTAHAKALRRNSRGRRAPYAAVTVLTGDLVLPGMDLMAKRDRLSWAGFRASTAGPGPGKGQEQQRRNQYGATRELHAFPATSFL
jgi:hypothetical protein